MDRRIGHNDGWVLGEKIGEGAFADVHAWAPGQVVKLFKPGVRRRTALYEAWMTRAAFAAGAPAPEVLDEVTVEARFGIVLSRLEGPTLRDLSRTGAMTSAQVGAILATVALSVHRTPAPPDVLSLRAFMEAALQLGAERLSPRISAGILPLIDRLPAADTLCHGDLHTGNVIVTAEGPRLIDWTGAVRAHVAFDLACSHVIQSEVIAEFVEDPARPRANVAEMQATYAQLAGMPLAPLLAAMEAYLPVARVVVLLSGAAPGRRDQLIQGVEAALGSG